MDRSHSSRLPADIYDCIIEHSRDDITTLASCALVCRRWLDRARFFLFKDAYIDLRTADKCSQLQSLPHHAITNGSKPITDLVRNVKISLPFFGELESSGKHHEFVRLALERLANLECLWINETRTKYDIGVPLTDHNLLQEALVEILRDRNSFHTLRIGENFTWLNTASLVDFIAALPNMRTLEIGGILFGREPLLDPESWGAPTVAEPVHASHSLKNVFVENEYLRCHTSALVPIIKLQHCIRLTTLHLTVFPVDSWEASPYDGSQRVWPLFRIFFQSQSLSSVQDLSLCYAHALSTQMGIGWLWPPHSDGTSLSSRWNRCMLTLHVQ